MSSSMLFGDPAIFSIESRITHAYERLSFRALGYFNLFIAGHRYGVHQPQATMLACSFDEVARRLAARGQHVAPFAGTANTEQIARAIHRALYGEASDDEVFFGVNLHDFSDIVYKNHLIWAPDGDAAFDDGSFVLQFDIDEEVRLIAYRSDGNEMVELTTLREVRLPADTYYATLESWRACFEGEWNQTPKQHE